MQKHTSTPLISIITVVRNDAQGLARTLASATTQDHSDREIIVIDGGSTDNTLEILTQYTSNVEQWISEPDEGTYHAMNKGIALATGQWLIFMNAGDEFASPTALSAAAANLNPHTDIVYADWIYRENDALAKADLRRMNVRHQSVMYRKSLHETYGLYVVGKGVTISDYVFFLSIADKHWSYCPQPLSICDKAGASGKPQHFYQRLAAELIFARRSRLQTVLILTLHPLYRVFKRTFLKVAVRGRVQ